MEKDYLAKKDAIKFLDIPEKNFENYFKYSKEIKGEKIRNRWYFNKEHLFQWRKTRDDRTIFLNTSEYEKCFEFAIKMVYGGLSLNGIRGQRTEVQAADDVILGILAEYAVKNLLISKFSTEIKLDEEVHTEKITPQDIDQVKIGNIFREPKIGVGVKASKMKNAFLVLGSNEVELDERMSDVYIFARVGLPSDHLFRILRDHSFFKNVKNFLNSAKGFKKILKLEKVPVWICGFTYCDELKKVTEIPGQEFDGYRYIRSVADMHNSDDEWKTLISLL